MDVNTLKAVIKKAAPTVKQENLDKYVPFLFDLMPKYGIDTTLRQRHFIAQLLHESACFSAVRENLNYSADGLLKTFAKYFDAQTAQEYARKPEKIANRVYANRLGNGNEASGDGWKYRGGGAIQTTGKTNYQTTGTAIGVDLVANPDLIADPQYYIGSACYFWQKNAINTPADKDDITAVTKKINGGTNGLEDRKKYYAALSELTEAAKPEPEPIIEPTPEPETPPILEPETKPQPVSNEKQPKNNFWTKLLDFLKGIGKKKY
jgi:putative chitinase